MTDDKNGSEAQAKPQASSSPPRVAEPHEKPQIEKLKLITNEEARLAAEIEKLRR